MRVLDDRLYESRRQRTRYHSDPAFRLDRINRVRVRRGMPVIKSLDEAKLRIV